MPCYQVNTTTVEFKQRHKDLLVKALEDLGWYAEWQGNRVTIPDYDLSIDLDGRTAKVDAAYVGRVNELKVAYSRQAVRKAARRVGWSHKHKGLAKGKIEGYVYR